MNRFWQFREKEWGKLQEKEKLGEMVWKLLWDNNEGTGGVEGKEEDGASDGFRPRERQDAAGDRAWDKARKGQSEASGLILPFFNHLFASVNINTFFCKEAILDSW